MTPIIFAWSWVDAWPEYTLNGEPFWSLINPAIWDRYVTVQATGSIEVTMAELCGYF